MRVGTVKQFNHLNRAIALQSNMQKSNKSRRFTISVQLLFETRYAILILERLLNWYVLSRDGIRWDGRQPEPVFITSASLNGFFILTISDLIARGGLL